MKPAEPRRRPNRNKDSAVARLAPEKSSLVTYPVLGIAVVSLVLTAALAIYWTNKIKQPPGPTGVSIAALPTIASAIDESKRLHSDNADLVSVTSEIAAGLLARFPSHPQAYNLAGQLYARFGLLEEAKTLWQASLDLNPSNTQIRTALASVLLESGDFAKAESILKEAYQQSPTPSIAYMLGTSLLNQGRLTEAEKSLTASIKQSPASFPNLVLLGQVLLQLRQPESAKQKFLAAAELAPDNPNVWFGLANACQAIGDMDEAASHRIRFNELQQQQLQSEITQAKAAGTITSLHDELAQDCFQVGLFYLEMGNRTETEKHWTTCLRLSPNDINTRFAIARIWNDRGNSAQALQVLRPLVNSNSADIQFLTQIGQAFVQLEAFSEADQVYERIIQQHPQSAVGYAARCELQLRLGKHSTETLDLARQAVQKSPSAPNQFLLSVAAHHVGNNNIAIRAIQEAIRLDPQNLQYQNWNLSLQD